MYLSRLSTILGGKSVISMIPSSDSLDPTWDKQVLKYFDLAAKTFLWQGKSSPWHLILMSLNSSFKKRFLAQKSDSDICFLTLFFWATFLTISTRMYILGQPLKFVCDKKILTLEFLISVALRLLILRNFSRGYALICRGYAYWFWPKVFFSRRLTLICPIFLFFNHVPLIFHNSLFKFLEGLKGCNKKTWVLYWFLTEKKTMLSLR